MGFVVLFHSHLPSPHTLQHSYSTTPHPPHPGALFRHHSLTDVGRRRLVHLGVIDRIADALRAVGSTAVALGRQKAAWQGRPPAGVDTVTAKLSQVFKLLVAPTFVVYSCCLSWCILPVSFSRYFVLLNVPTFVMLCILACTN
jgi:hypothetical protein